MAKKKDEYLVIPVEEKEMDERQSPNESTDPAEEELEEKFDKEFWLKVMHNIVVIRWSLFMFGCLLHLLWFSNISQLKSIYKSVARQTEFKFY